MNDTPFLVKIETDTPALLYRHVDILKTRLAQRTNQTVSQTDKNPQLILALTDDLPNQAFQIEQLANCTAARISAGTPLGLLYGIGKYLRTSQYHPTFIPSTWQGQSIPHGSLRGVYFASHFQNWYEMADDDQITRYLEDLALWGVNTVMAIHPILHLTGWDDPESDPALKRLIRLFKIAKKLGLATATAVNNVMFTTTPKPLHAPPVPDPLIRHGNSGTTVCPSTPQGMNLILQTNMELLQKLADVGLDYLCVWPYDEGGCGCPQCHPWGANGFPKMAHALADSARRLFPHLKVILSTWTFDTPPQNEWPGLADYLNANPNWADYILTDAHEDFPDYPLQNPSPGNLPLINFPEISMWGNWPWGGFGAHPLPQRLQKLWNQAKHTLTGGFPYSEGIYDDISKTVVSQFYWNPDCSAQDTLKEYINYEFAAQNVNTIMTLINILENTASQTLTEQPIDQDAVRQAAQIAQTLNDHMPEWVKHSWRWEILYLRALLDQARFSDQGLNTPQAQTALKRLIEIYRCPQHTDNEYHHRVRPPLTQTAALN